MDEKPTYQELEKRTQQLEQTLQKAENKYRILLDESSDPIFSFYPDGTYRFVNQAFAEGVGKSVDEIIGHSIWDIFPGEEGDKRFSVVKDVFATGKSRTIEVRVPRPEVDQYYITTAKAAKDENGKVISVMCSSKNITDRKQTEEMLRESEEKHRLFFENAPIGIIHYSNKGIITTVNEAMVTTFGSSREKLIGLDIDDISNKKFAKEVYGSLNGKTGYFEGEYYSYTGKKTSYIKAIWIPIKQKNEILAGIGIVEDITERKKAEEELRLSEEKYRHLVENANEAIFVLQDGEIKFFNDKAKQIGSELRIELDLDSFDNYIHPKDRDMVIDRHIRRLQGEKLPDTYAFRLIGKDGQEMCVEINTIKVSWEGRAATLNFLRDITFQRKLEQQLQLSQKMEAVGTLAGGVAHDFNNLLMGIQGRTSLMMLEISSTHPSFEHLQEIEACVQKAAKLTKQLLGFARGGKYEIKPTDLNDLVENNVQMFGRTKKEITIFKKYEKKLWSAAVDQSQIDQVLLNIFVNAWQAMPEGGDLYIQTKNDILDENLARAHGAAPGKFIKISIMDTGIGMDDKTMKSVFDPFFTTKEKERGTGLGLASAYGIIKNHNGIITVDSKKGKGATFNVYLPASDKAVVEEKGYEQKILIGSETVLLVDDEAMIIDVSVLMLKNMGYEVLTAHNGKEAIEIYKQNADRIAIVVLDLVMPDMDGGEVYQRLKEIDSNVKVLLSSGYSLNDQAAEILNHGCDGFIQKPFKLNELSIKLREII